MDNKMHRLWVHMADHEWGNRKMDSLALEYAARHANKRPLIITVHEHGGWWLSYLFDDQHHGLIVGTANDMARLSPAATAAGERYKDYEPAYSGCYRRGEPMEEATHG
jgi:hypothetical protein